MYNRLAVQRAVSPTSLHPMPPRACPAGPYWEVSAFESYFKLALEIEYVVKVVNLEKEHSTALLIL